MADVRTEIAGRGDIVRVAAETFGWESLRPEQLEAMEALLAGRDVLAVLPTGAGKSAIYQVPALLLEGATVVVSPLIALQHDQISGLEAAGAPAAVAVNSSLGADELREAWRELRGRTAAYVFLAPEQLAKDDVLAALNDTGVALVAVDEAHCVSAWGHDFRPDYLRIGAAIERLGRPRTLALTATAAPPVRADIAAALGLRDAVEVLGSFDRPNLHLSVARHVEDRPKRAGVIDLVRRLSCDRDTRPGLLYTATRKDAEAYGGELSRGGARVAAYHAGMRAGDRGAVHEAFLADHLDVVVATSAFGMGIDKPDVRFVVHASVPESPDAYYQQIGRAGRDGGAAHVELFYRVQDLGLQRSLTAAGAPEEVVAQVAAALRRVDGSVRPRDLGDGVKASAAARTRALNLLERTGAVVTTRTGRVRYADPAVPVAEAVEHAVEAAERHRRIIRSRIEMMRGYAETTGCRRQFLLGYFGEHIAHPCGACDTCEAGTAEDRAEPAARAGASVHGGDGHRVNAHVRHREWGHGVVMSVEPDRLTVLFDDVGYRTLSEEAVRAHNLFEPDGEVPPPGAQRS